ncbi:uncharacterized protein LOC128174607 [Crassostrea angulata]|uniref:uncharacterized protein LOC128174607 n=1 Tax=Magallana angulata TaxID=2784310 RepID=UPI0022B09CC6|nr:uncharacterized protein LOC128174607 [Crassostrea angulata]
MDTNCRLINGRAVCPPVHFITPRMRDQESDESLDISITSLVLALLLLLGWIAKRLMRHCTRVRRRSRGLETIPKECFEMEPRQGINQPPQRPTAPPPPPQARSLPEPPPRAPPARSLAQPPPRAPAGGGGEIISAQQRVEFFQHMKIDSLSETKKIKTYDELMMMVESAL